MVSRSTSSNQPLFRHSPGTNEWQAEVVDAALRRVDRAPNCFEGDTGQEISTRTRPDESGPLFLTRRLALEWMVYYLERSDQQNP